MPERAQPVEGRPRPFAYPHRGCGNISRQLCRSATVSRCTLPHRLDLDAREDHVQDALQTHDRRTGPSLDPPPAPLRPRAPPADATRLRCILASLAEGVVAYDRDGRVETWNPAASRILEMDPDEMQRRMLAEPGWAAVREDGTPLAPEELPWAVARATGVPVRNVRLGLRRRDGTQLWISVSAAPAGRAGGVVASFREVTERFLSDRRLRGALAASQALVARLREDLRKVETLGGLVPVCAACHGIRVDARYWSGVEAYAAEHAGARVAHGLCPACEDRLLSRGGG